jgi:hypothetical protein
MAQVHAIEQKTFSSPDENETPISRSSPLVNILTDLSQLQRKEYKFIIQPKKQFILRKNKRRKPSSAGTERAPSLGRCNIFVKVVLSPPTKHEK